MSTTPPSGPRSATRQRWWTRRAVVAHGVLLVWIPACAMACWWQVGVALSGDSLGWIYSVMWPCFAVFATVFWWHFVHDDPDAVGRRGLRRAEPEAAARAATTTTDRDEVLVKAEAEDPELAEYNAYLAALARDGRPGTWRVP